MLIYFIICALNDADKKNELSIERENVYFKLNHNY